MYTWLIIWLGTLTFWWQICFPLSPNAILDLCWWTRQLNTWKEIAPMDSAYEVLSLHFMSEQGVNHSIWMIYITKRYQMIMILWESLEWFQIFNVLLYWSISSVVSLYCSCVIAVELVDMLEAILITIFDWKQFFSFSTVSSISNRLSIWKSSALMIQTWISSLNLLW